jgi:hypothetical protein
MGLLDDAIREHLEFKRQHGADLDEVARQEDEALGPVDRGYEASPALDADPAEEGSVPQEGQFTPAAASARAAIGADVAHGGQETAELDMRTVLKAEPEAAAEGAAGDSLEWEMPGDSRSDLGAGGGTEGSLGAAGGEAGGEGESVEDVLEETPDFLRDTPDQERLWFEQQPPRDFDFDG